MTAGRSGPVLPALGDYSTLVFDCDGVVLDSNRVKTEAFHVAARPWGRAAADALVAHHVAQGGISRYAKFAYFLDRILPDLVPGGVPTPYGPDLESLLASYAAAVRKGLLTCALTEGLAALRARLPGTRWLIVSGGDQRELREILAQRGLAEMFDGGIFGSPDTKDAILTRERDNGRFGGPGLFLGDSRYDHLAADRAGLDFAFLHGWTEMPDWPDYIARHGIPTAPRVCDLPVRQAVAG